MNTQHQPKASNGGFRAEELNRRRFQQLAGTVLDRHGEAIAQLQALDKVRGEFMADMSVRVDACDHNDTAEEVARKLDVSELRGRLIAFQQRTFWQRFRWLFLGK